MAEEIHLDQDSARAGETPHIVRYVLGISVLLAVIAMTIIWVTGALNSNGTGSAGSSTVNSTSSTGQASALPPPDQVTPGTHSAPSSEQNQRSPVTTSD